MATADLSGDDIDTEVLRSEARRALKPASHRSGDDIAQSARAIDALAALARNADGARLALRRVVAEAARALAEPSRGRGALAVIERIALDAIGTPAAPGGEVKEDERG